MSWLDKQKLTRKKFHESIKQGRITEVFKGLNRIVKNRMSLWWNDRSGFLTELKKIQANYQESREALDYQQSADSIGSLLNFMDKLDQTRTNLRLLWIPISFVILSFLGFYLNKVFEGTPETYQCNGSDKASCAILVAPFGGSENDIDQALFSILSNQQKNWYTVHNLSSDDPESDKYNFLENVVYPDCNPKIMVYGQGNEGSQNMDVDLKLFSLEFPIKESLDIEDAQYFSIPSFSQQNLENLFINEGMLATIESYLIRVCDQDMAALKSSIESMQTENHHPELMNFMYQNAAEAFWDRGEPENAEILLSKSIRNVKDPADALAMRGLMRDEIGKNTFGAFEDYSEYLKISAENHTVRKRRFYSIQQHFKDNDQSLPSAHKKDILSALQYDFRKITSLARKEDETYLNELSEFIRQLNSTEIPATRFMYYGKMTDYPSLSGKNLQIEVSGGDLSFNKNNGEFKISSTQKSLLVGQTIFISANGYKPKRIPIQEQYLNTESPWPINLEFEELPAAEKWNYTLCPYSSKSRYVLRNLNTDNVSSIRRASFVAEDLGRVKQSLELNGKQVKYKINPVSDQSAILYVLGGPIHVFPYYRRRLLSEKADVTLVINKNVRETSTLILRDLTRLPAVNMSDIERYTLKWNTDAKSYMDSAFNFSKICEIQQNKWKVFIAVKYGEQEIGVEEITNWDQAIAQQKIDLKF